MHMKHHFKKCLRLGILFLGISTFIISSCSNEELLTIEEQQVTNLFEKNFSMSNFNDPTKTIKGNIEINWQDDIINDIKQYSFHQFNVATKNKAILNSNYSSSTYTLKLLAYQDNEHINYYLAKFLPFADDKKNWETINYFDMSYKYSGMVYLYNLKGEIELSEVYEYGKLIRQIVHQDNIFVNSGIKMARCVEPEQRISENNSGCFPGGGGTGGYYQEIITEHYIDWYQHIDTVGGYEIYQWTSEQYTGSTTTWVWVSDPNYDPGLYSVQYANSVTDEALNGANLAVDNISLFKIKLDATFISNVKLKCTYDKLTADNNSLFRNTVGVFVDDPKFNLTFKVGNCIQTNDQCTDRSDPNNIIITFEDVGISPIEMAQAILHESIHAEIARFVTQYESDVDVNDRPRLFQLFKYYSSQYGSGDIQHVYMTEKYINPMASALKEFDNHKYPVDYYKSFAWDGLRDWDANNLLSMEMNTTYNSYRTIVIQNSTVCN